MINSEQILAYYKRQGGKQELKKILSEFEDSYKKEVDFLKKAVADKNALIAFTQNTDFEKYISAMTSEDKFKISLKENLNDIDGRIKYLIELFDALQKIYMDAKDKENKKGKLLKMVVARLLHLCIEKRKYILEEVKKQRMAGDTLEVLHENFGRVEPLIRNDFEKALGKNMDKSGYPFSIKSSDSIRSKIAMAQRNFFRDKGYSDLEACKRCVIDAIRYTALYSLEVYVQGYKDAISKLDKEGYKLIRCKNFWKEPGAYNGINCLFLTPYGYFVEVQFHTNESKQLNLDTHKLYEEQRDVRTSEKRKQEIAEQMQKLAESSTPEKSVLELIKKINSFELSEIVWSLPPS